MATVAPKLAAESRHEFGKGAARRIRRANKIPAVLYGHGTDPIHMTLPGHQTMLLLKNANAIFTIDLEGSEHLALAKDVQRDAIKPIIEHIDLVVVRRGEKVVVEIPVHVDGEAAIETVVTLENSVLSVLADAFAIPEAVVISVEGLTAGTQILAKDVVLPEGTELDADEEMLVINIVQQQSVEDLETELEAAEAEAGLEREESDEDEAADEDTVKADDSE
ncbi:MAG: 50S ribosomal protein L25/general stress protein Ctc [Allobranchiibius sp.]